MSTLSHRNVTLFILARLHIYLFRNIFSNISFHFCFVAIFEDGKVVLDLELHCHMKRVSIVTKLDNYCSYMPAEGFNTIMPIAGSF